MKNGNQRGKKDKKTQTKTNKTNKKKKPKTKQNTNEELTTSFVQQSVFKWVLGC